MKRDRLPLQPIARWFDDYQQLRAPRVTVAAQEKRLDVQGDRLIPSPQLLRVLTQDLQLQECDLGMVQCLGVADRVFHAFELSLMRDLKEELLRLEAQIQPSLNRRRSSTPPPSQPGISPRNAATPNPRLQQALHHTWEGLQGRHGAWEQAYQQPCALPVYWLHCLPNAVYSAYLLWFWVYQRGLLLTNPRILDLAGGANTVMMGLALLLQTMAESVTLPEMQVTYASIDASERFQASGWKLWQRYCTENAAQIPPTNIFFQSHTFPLTDYIQWSETLPHSRFDFITIAHGFFTKSRQYDTLIRSYRQIIHDRLAPNGYVLLIIQGSQIWQTSQGCNLEAEHGLIQHFVEGDLGLELEWCRYLSSTGQRGKIDNLYTFQRQFCPPQHALSSIARTYFNYDQDLHYFVDSYLILAKQT